MTRKYENKKEKINVILDTDTYNECDDQFALSYLIKSQDKFNIEAITVAPYSHKNRNISVKEGQELSYNEILKICKWLNFDTTNKVFKGSMGYLQNGYTENNPAVNKIIDVALKNKDDLLENKVNLEVDIHNEKVLTDSKWLEFVLNQIINNSIKYKKNNNDPIIKISVKDEKDKVYLTIWDNGIGIPKNDIKRVFDKSFTGENGRIMAKSTGMGLYIVKKLCDKLGHKIIIESEIHKYTKITIIFYKNDFYKVD